MTFNTVILHARASSVATSLLRFVILASSLRSRMPVAMSGVRAQVHPGGVRCIY
jgi:hypothetical protein